MVNRVAYQSLQLHGGYGYMEECRICRLSRDVRALSIFADISEIMKLVIRRNLGLRGYDRQPLDALGVENPQAESLPALA
ncbi:hypothetical protein DFAR_2970004 [Desulfarculales bacterium]